MDLPQRQRIAGNAASVEKGLVGKRPRNGLQKVNTVVRLRPQVLLPAIPPRPLPEGADNGTFAGGNRCATAAAMSEIFGRNENCF